MPNSARVDREKRAEGMIASLAISPNSRIQDIPDSPAEIQPVAPAGALVQAPAVTPNEPAKEQLVQSADQQADDLDFLDIDFEMVDAEKVNKTLLIKQSEPKSLGLTEPDLNSLRKVVERLYSFRFQYRSEALVRKFVHDTGATRHIICQKGYF